MRSACGITSSSGGTGKMKERNEQKIYDESVSFDLCKKDYVQIITTAIVLIIQ